MAALVSAAFLLISCRKEEEPTLIDDQEIFGSSETAAATEVSESGSPSESTETPYEPKPPRVIPVPKGLVSDPAVLEFAYYDWYLNDEHAFAAEDDRIYYARKRTMIPTESAPEMSSGVFRSEEHTSELQSHRFISYAVFCLSSPATRSEEAHV